MCYVWVHLSLTLGEMSMCCVLRCVWEVSCGMFVCLWGCVMSGGFVFYAVPCCGSREHFCAGGGFIAIVTPCATLVRTE